MNAYIFASTTTPNNSKTDYNRTIEELKVYTSQNCESLELMASIFESDPASPMATMPTDLTDEEKKDEFKRALYMEDLKEYKRNERKIMSGNTKIFQCIIGQCTEELKAKIQCLNDYEKK